MTDLITRAREKLNEDFQRLAALEKLIDYLDGGKMSPEVLNLLREQEPKQEAREPKAVGNSRHMSPKERSRRWHTRALEVLPSMPLEFTAAEFTRAVRSDMHCRRLGSSSVYGVLGWLVEQGSIEPYGVRQGHGTGTGVKLWKKAGPEPRVKGASE